MKGTIDTLSAFPQQRLPFKSKGKAWREKCVDWGANHAGFTYVPVMKSITNMKINYDLVNGKIHMKDVAAILNPGNMSTMFLPEKIQHYPIINSKLNTLRGEEAARVFDWHVVVINPTSVSQIEEDKKNEFFARVQSIIENQQIDDQQAAEQVKETQDYMNFNYQDLRERRGNELLKHYSLEQNYKQIFSEGFMDAMTVAEEVYHCGIEGGEPVLRRLNPMKLHPYQNGYSCNIEDCDVLVYEDYWSRGRVLDVFHDDLKEKDLKWLYEDVPDYGGQTPVGAAGNYDDRYGFVDATKVIGEDGIAVNGGIIGEWFDGITELEGGIGSNMLPYDAFGNVRIIQVWWKSARKVLSVKSFDPETGEEVLDLYPETYVPNEAAGEVAETFWINEAWEGTKIGDSIYCRIRPCLVQYNTLTNPSRCHFGIVGTIYNLNESKPFSLVDMMKPYNYLYDAIHAKLVDLIATNWGKLVEMDLALIPKGWDVKKWMYFARTNKVLIRDSFREGDKGAALGKLAAGLNNASKGYVDADWGQSIQNYINMLTWVYESMSNLVGINRQREGNTYSRETAGGIERAVLQSSYITDWLFQKHEDTKRRVLTVVLETAKVAAKGRKIKFRYIMSDGSWHLMEIDGDEFAESDYGLIVDNSNDTQKLYQQIDTLAQAALQNQAMGLSQIMQLYTSSSLSEKIRMVGQAEKEMQQQQQQMQQQQMQLEQQKLQAQQQIEAQKMQQQDALNQRDNETKIRVAEINSQAEYLRLGIYAEENDEQLVHDKLDVEREKIRADIEALDKEFQFKREELKQKKELELKKIEAQKQIAKSKTSSTSSK